eukprot:gene15232-biopygen4950
MNPTLLGGAAVGSRPRPRDRERPAPPECCPEALRGPSPPTALRGHETLREVTPGRSPRGKRGSLQPAEHEHQCFPKSVLLHEVPTHGILIHEPRLRIAQSQFLAFLSPFLAGRRPAAGGGGGGERRCGKRWGRKWAAASAALRRVFLFAGGAPLFSRRARCRIIAVTGGGGANGGARRWGGANGGGRSGGMRALLGVGGDAAASSKERPSGGPQVISTRRSAGRAAGPAARNYGGILTAGGRGAPRRGADQPLPPVPPPQTRPRPFGNKHQRLLGSWTGPLPLESSRKQLRGVKQLRCVEAAAPQTRQEMRHGLPAVLSPVCRRVAPASCRRSAPPRRPAVASEWSGIVWKYRTCMNGMELSVIEWVWSAIEWNGMEWSGMERNGMKWSGVEWNGEEWSVVEWSGVEWSGV